MHRIFVFIVLVAVAAPISAQAVAVATAAEATLAPQAQSEREIERRLQELERERERLERERERAREQAERDRERARAQAERDRERARAQTERGRGRDGGVEEVERITRTLRIGTSGELHLANIAGDIVISRGSGNEAQVAIVKTARARTSADAREMLKLVQIDVAERPTRAEISTRYPEGDWRRANRRDMNVSVAFTVTVPPATRVRASSISGNVSVKDVRGDLVLKSVSGHVQLASGGGACTAETISGDVEITDSALEGSIVASTASGTVAVRRVKARRIGANSISGDVTLEGAESASIEAKSVSGNVRLMGPLGRSSRYELGSHSGDLHVAVGSGAGFEVQATSFSGGIRSDFQFSTSGADATRGRVGRSLRGVVGDGGAVLNLSTFSGSISITKR